MKRILKVYCGPGQRRWRKSSGLEQDLMGIQGVSPVFQPDLDQH
jgi:hypothetical protein